MGRGVDAGRRGPGGRSCVHRSACGRHRTHRQLAVEQRDRWPGIVVEAVGKETIPRSAWVALYLTSVGQALAILQSSVLNIAFPSIEATFSDTPRSTLAWVITGFSIASAALLLLAGRLADIYGRRRIFFFGIAVFSIASLGCGLAPTPMWLIVFRIVQALGSAFMIPTSLSLVMPLFPRSRQSMVVAIWAAVASVAGAAGPPIGAAIIEFASWRWIFIMNAPIGLAVVLIGRRVLVENKGERSPDARIDLFGVPVGSAGIALLTLGLLQGSQWGWSDKWVLACFALTPLLLGLLVWRSSSHPEPLLDLSVFRLRRFSVASGSMLVFNLGVSAFWFSAPVYMQTVWGWSPLRTGLAVTPSPLVVLLGSRWVGQLADGGRLRSAIVAGMMLAAGSTFGIGVMLSEEPNYWTGYFFFSLTYGMGLALAWSMLTSAALVGVDERLYGVANGTSLTARTIGSALGIALVVALAGGADNASKAAFQPVWYAMAGVYAFSAALFITFYPRDRVGSGR